MSSTFSSDSDEPIFEECSEYSKIENHLSFSKTIYLIKQKGKNILENFKKHKYEKKNRRGASLFIGDVSTIYINLTNIVHKTNNTLNLFFCLKYYLDELMFGEIKNLTTFTIEDQNYDLTKVYYHASEWIQDQDTQSFEFYDEMEVNINEAMYLVCYLKEFEDLFLQIEEYLKTFKDTYTIKKKLIRITNRLRLKLKIIWDIIIEIINNKL